MEFVLPFVTDSMAHQDPTWHEIIVSLLTAGHIWEAQILFPICLRHAQPADDKALFSIFNAIPNDDDTVHTLVRWKMLVACSNVFALGRFSRVDNMLPCTLGGIHDRWREI